MVKRTSIKITRVVRQIKALSVNELLELNNKLKEEGMTPLEYTGVPAKPKNQPPSLSQSQEAVL